MPYGLFGEERGWTCTETKQPTSEFLQDEAVGCRWNFGFSWEWETMKSDRLDKCFPVCFLGAYLSALLFLFGWIDNSMMLKIISAILFFVFIFYLVVVVIIKCETMQPTRRKL